MTPHDILTCALKGFILALIIYVVGSYLYEPTGHDGWIAIGFFVMFIVVVTGAVIRFTSGANRKEGNKNKSLSTVHGSPRITADPCFRPGGLSKDLLRRKI
jgi:hypothetical protein